MYYLLSIFIGLIITVMVVFNGELTAFYGVYISTAIIHFIGLSFVSIFCLIKKTKLFTKNISFIIYLGGAIGVITILFNNLAFNKISVSAIVALSLLGQAITSIVFDNYGFFNMPKQAFNKKKCISLFFMILGVIYMLSSFNSLMIIPIILSLFTGITVVTSRTINARLAQHTSMLASTWYNYFVGLIVSILLLLIFYRDINLASFSLSKNISIYLGGVLGSIAVFLCNIAVTKISSYYMTLLLFVGQVFSGIIVDIVLTSQFSSLNLIGGSLVAIGLSIDIWIDKKMVDVKK